MKLERYAKDRIRIPVNTTGETRCTTTFPTWMTQALLDNQCRRPNNGSTIAQ